MRKDMRLEIHHDGSSLTAVKINDDWIPVTSINIDFKRGEIPIAAVELEMPYADIKGERVLLYLHPSTVALLKAGGWRPPEDENAEDTGS